MEQNVNSSDSQGSLGTRIQQILDEQRSLAYDALDDLMYEAFLEVGHVLTENGDADQPQAVGGLSSYALRQIRQHVADGNLAEWLSAGADGDKSLYLRDFLNFNKLQMDELRVRYPRAFSKWTEDEDEALLVCYRQEAQQGQKIPWVQIAKQLQRNPNAIRLRLEHLGINLGSDAGRQRRQGGAAR